MACGCKKKSITVNLPNQSKPTPIMNRQITQPQPRSLLTVMPNRCPLCSTGLRRISRPGQGELLQCMNPKCGYLRKV